MQAIVAADANWGIGRNGTLLVRIPADMKRFRQMTTGKVVVLGRKTLQTFPQGAPLADRDNIILSRNPSFRVKGAAVVRDAEELSRLISDVAPEDVFCIGGGQIYELLLPQCDVCHVTRLERGYDADAYFPNLEADPAWELAEESDEQTYFDTAYTYQTWKRVN